MAAPKVVDRDLGWRAVLKAAIAASGGSYVKVGVLSDDEQGGLHQVDPDTGKAADLTVAEIAAVLEYGTEDGHIPERSFVRATFDEERDALQARARQLLVLVVLDRKLPVGQALGLLGAQLANAIKRKVTSGAGVPPPNAPSTALAKASTGKTAKYFGRKARTLGDALAQAGALAAVRPLVDTGRMVGAVTWAVVMGRFSEGMGNRG